MNESEYNWEFNESKLKNKLNKPDNEHIKQLKDMGLKK